MGNEILNFVETKKNKQTKKNIEVSSTTPTHFQETFMIFDFALNYAISVKYLQIKSLNVLFAKLYLTLQRGVLCNI